MKGSSVIESCLFTTLMLAAVATSARADSVGLKNGTSYYNVKVMPQGERLFIVFKDGSIRKVHRDQVKSYRVLPVNWAREKRPDAMEMNRLIHEAVQKELKREVAREVQKQMQEKIESARRKERGLKETTSDALWRSALLPGWGQYSRGDSLKSTLYFSSAFFLFGRYRHFWLTHRTAQREYRDLAPSALIIAADGGSAGSLSMNALLFQDRRANLEKREQETNFSLGALGLVWLWNIFDAYYFEPNKIKATGSSSGSMRVLFALDPNRIGVGLEVRF